MKKMFVFLKVKHLNAGECKNQSGDKNKCSEPLNHILTTLFNRKTLPFRMGLAKGQGSGTDQIRVWKISRVLYESCLICFD